MTEYALIGDGRLATSLAAWLPTHGMSVRQWSRRREASGECAELSSVLDHASFVLIAIRDDAIIPWAVENSPLLEGRTLIHFSGALIADGIHAFHPLYAFPPEPVPVSCLDQVAFIGDEDGAVFGDVFPTLPNPNFTLLPAQRPLYHAFAVLAGNLATFLWNETAAGMWNDLGLPPSKVLTPYLRGLIENFEAAPFDSLTGPVKRRDTDTVNANLDALREHPALRELYEAFLTAAWTPSPPRR